MRLSAMNRGCHRSGCLLVAGPPSCVRRAGGVQESGAEQHRLAVELAHRFSRQGAQLLNLGFAARLQRVALRVPRIHTAAGARVALVRYFGHGVCSPWQSGHGKM